MIPILLASLVLLTTPRCDDDRLTWDTAAGAAVYLVYECSGQPADPQAAGCTLLGQTAGNEWNAGCRTAPTNLCVVSVSAAGVKVPVASCRTWEAGRIWDEVSQLVPCGGANVCAIAGPVRCLLWTVEPIECAPPLGGCDIWDCGRYRAAQ